MDGQELRNEVFYPVSEAVQRTGVPPHVLRYWEEELGITVKRNHLGHRLYSEADVELFRRVRRLKDSGIQLKAIRTLLQEKQEDGEKADGAASGRSDAPGAEAQQEEPLPGLSYEIVPAPEPDHFFLFQAILRNLMEEVAREQNARLEQSLRADFRTEAEALYLQFCQEAKREAAASDASAGRSDCAGPGKARNRLTGWLSGFLSGRRGRRKFNMEDKDGY